VRLEDLSLEGQAVLLRVDFNVPLDNERKVTDASRIKAALPTIRFILEKGGRLILMSHLGRPEKKLNEDGTMDRERFSLRHIVPTINHLLGKPVQFVEDTIGAQVKQAVAALQNGDVLLLENTRFYKEEKKGDENFAKELASLADIYINDAFGAAHRAHASTATVAKFFPENRKAFGLLMRKELESAKRLIENPEKPYIAIIGGAKVSDKILLLDRLADIVDVLIIGGGMAFTLLKAQGAAVGSSLLEEDKLDVARAFLDKAAAKAVTVLLPEDSVIADKFDNEAQRQVVSSFEIPDGWMGLDIGPKAQAAFEAAISTAKSILWNGPMGVFELANFSAGTYCIAAAVATATQNGAFSLVGGGDSVAALHKAGKADAISHVSTGGGATLELLQGNVLPGIVAIQPLEEV
jgi:phosphoglycerate kinase